MRLYARGGESTYAPSGLARSAIVVATAGGRTHYYAFERGARLADGSAAKGRRVYFGLYDDTFRQLSAEGLRLFAAAAAWAAR